MKKEMSTLEFITKTAWLLTVFSVTMGTVIYMLITKEDMPIYNKLLLIIVLLILISVNKDKD